MPLLCPNTASMREGAMSAFQGADLPSDLPVAVLQLFESNKKDLVKSLYDKELGLQAKDGIRTRDIHLGKVELYP